jgi:hypothetical protein
MNLWKIDFAWHLLSNRGPWSLWCRVEKMFWHAWDVMWCWATWGKFKGTTHGLIDKKLLKMDKHLIIMDKSILTRLLWLRWFFNGQSNYGPFDRSNLCPNWHHLFFILSKILFCGMQVGHKKASRYVGGSLTQYI